MAQNADRVLLDQTRCPSRPAFQCTPPPPPLLLGNHTAGSKLATHPPTPHSPAACVPGHESPYNHHGSERLLDLTTMNVSNPLSKQSRLVTVTTVSGREFHKLATHWVKKCTHICTPHPDFTAQPFHWVASSSWSSFQVSWTDSPLCLVLCAWAAANAASLLCCGAELEVVCVRVCARAGPTTQRWLTSTAVHHLGLSFSSTGQPGGKRIFCLEGSNALVDRVLCRLFRSEPAGGHLASSPPPEGPSLHSLKDTVHVSSCTHPPPMGKRPRPIALPSLQAVQLTSVLQRAFAKPLGRFWQSLPWWDRGWIPIPGTLE